MRTDMVIFGKPKKKHKPQGNPAWLTWSVTILIAYVLFSQYTNKKNLDGQGQKNNALTEQKEEVAVAPVAVAPVAEQAKPEAEAQKNHLPDGVKIAGEIEGRGEAATCGHLLDIVYDEVAPDNADFKARDNVKLSLRSGVNQSELWHSAFAGMKVGGVRKINVVAGDVYDEKQLTDNGLKSLDALEYKVELKHLEPLANADEIAMQIVELEEGEGAVAACNQIAEFALVIWGADGKRVYENNAIEMRIGNVDYFYGLDKALNGMKIGGERMAIIPPAYGALNEAKKDEFEDKIQPNQMIIAQIKLLSIK
jgi:FKBP-type peptidyl-prolyl cis-trans isomerase